MSTIELSRNLIMKIKPISQKEFFKKHKAEEIRLVSSGIFTKSDYDEMCKEFGIQNVTNKLLQILKVELLLAIRNPVKVLLNLRRILNEQISGVKKHYNNETKSLDYRYPISDYAMKARVVKSFNPKKILEIGTWHGWGISAIKSACPEAECFTMNPKSNNEANNPINETKIGRVYKKLKLEINQIWANSMTFDFSKIPAVDVCYIDGNHEYDYVMNDIKNCTKISKKAVIIDDYIPSPSSDRGDVLTYAWNNKEVVNAVDDYLAKEGDKCYSAAYWIEGTPICVLIK